MSRKAVAKPSRKPADLATSAFMEFGAGITGHRQPRGCDLFFDNLVSLRKSYAENDDAAYS
jgi:hypothetical protein